MIRRTPLALALALILVAPIFLLSDLREASANQGGRLDHEAAAEARMLAFLAEEFHAAAQVDPAFLEIVTVAPETVGDILVYRVTAIVDAEGKEVTAFFDSRDGRFVSYWLPTYHDVTQEKFGYELARWLREAPPGATARAFVIFHEPAGFLRADDVVDPNLLSDEAALVLGPEIALLAQEARSGDLLQREKYYETASRAMVEHNFALLEAYLAALAPKVAAVPGVVAVENMELVGTAEVIVTAGPAALAALAAMPEVLALEMVRSTKVDLLIDQSRLASGAADANNQGLRGSGKKVMSMDTGVSPVTSSTNCLPTAGAQSFVDGVTSTTDSANHGTAVAWVIRGGKTSGGSLCSYEGIARDSSLYNAKIMHSGTVAATETDWQEAITWGSGTVFADVSTTSASNGAHDTGNHWMSTRIDYNVHVNNRVYSSASANVNNAVYAPGSAYNIVTNGAYDDKNTGSTKSDDTLWPNSPQLTTTSYGRKKPELVQPGVNIALPTNDNTGALYDHTGTSVAAPHSAAGMALWSSPIFTGRERKCALLSSISNTGGDWSVGWGWGKPWIGNGQNTDGFATSSVSQGGVYETSSITLPGLSNIYAYLIWWRELSGPTTVTRVSDLDFRLINVANGATLDYSTSSQDNTEGLGYSNGGSTSMTVKLRVNGYTVSGSAQQFTLCWDVRGQI